ncbi:MAG: polysulfide reductase NrfD [candidate division Zixibacteria bacterium]|nr:polysulfide reductase NrfD [candidate division Zixibacteria bacterium]
MTEYAEKATVLQAWVRERLFLGLTIKEYIKRLIGPFNIVAGIIILIGLPFVVMRFTQGLGAVTHASQDQPWGLFLTWGLFTGVPLAATGYIMASAVYLFGLKDYHSLVRPAILTGLIGYLFAVVFLLFDLGRPWRLPYPMTISFGTTSVLFLVGWHVALYLSTQLVEFCPAIFEWIGSNRFRRWALRVTIGATIFGVILSTLHQSALGALFLLAPGKLHPLWYSEFIPVLFFISSIFAGLSMVIAESTLSRRALRGQMDPHRAASFDRLTMGLGRAAALVLLTYFCLKWVGVAHGNHWNLLSTSWGHWFLVEVFVFALLPCFLFVYGVRNRNVGIIRFTAFFTILGVVINRFNVSLIALNWKLPHREFFHWRELILVITIITVEILIYRWIVNRMPVHREHPDYRGAD